jgi:hypothetical protein
MIAPLRRNHLWIWVVLTPLIALVLAAALVVSGDEATPRNEIRWEGAR